jgi:hypothetical protein
MKIAMLSVLVVAFASGCSSVPPIQQAKDECSQMGFVPGTAMYGNCMLKRVQSIEDNRPRLRVGPPSDSFMQSLNTPIHTQPRIINQGPTTITCVQRIGNRVECN